MVICLVVHLIKTRGTQASTMMLRAVVSVLAVTAMLLSAQAFDLGPIVRIAQCRSQCLKVHSLDGSCEWWRHGETGCSEVCYHFLYLLSSRVGPPCTARDSKILFRESAAALRKALHALITRQIARSIDDR